MENVSSFSSGPQALWLLLRVVSVAGLNYLHVHLSPRSYKLFKDRDWGPNSQHLAWRTGGAQSTLPPS